MQYEITPDEMRAMRRDFINHCLHKHLKNADEIKSWVRKWERDYVGYELRRYA